MNVFAQLKIAIAILVASLLLASCTSSAVTSQNAYNSASQTSRLSTDPQIYMFRGGFNGVFSTGITDMAAELHRKGVPAKDLSWSASSSSLAKIRKAKARNPNAGPIILVGHSLGASSVVGMARELTRDDIVVDLLIVFDPLGGSRVPSGVRKVINFKASGSKSNPGNFRAGKDFDGEIVNVDIRNLPGLEKASHWNIVNQANLQERVIREIEAAYRQYQKDSPSEPEVSRSIDAS